MHFCLRAEKELQLLGSCHGPACAAGRGVRGSSVASPALHRSRSGTQRGFIQPAARCPPLLPCVLVQPSRWSHRPRAPRPQSPLCAAALCGLARGAGEPRLAPEGLDGFMAIVIVNALGKPGHSQSAHWGCRRGNLPAGMLWKRWISAGIPWKERAITTPSFVAVRVLRWGPAERAVR